MPETLLSIADITIRLKSKSLPEEETTNHFRYDHFILKDIPSGVDIDLDLKITPRYKIYKRKELFRAERDTPKAKRFNFEGKLGRKAPHLNKREERYLGEGLEWRISRIGKKMLIEGGSSGRYQLLINEYLNKGEIFIINADNKWMMTDVIYGFLQVLIIYYLGKKRLGTLFHSAGLHDGERGFLFAGLSCAGKSTTSRIWDKIPEVNILNDDRIIVRKNKGRLYMYSTPWHGDYSEYFKGDTVKKAKLSKLFYIYHRDTNLAEKMDSIDGFNHFFKTLFLSFWDKECVKFTFDFLVDIMSQKACYKFGFKNDSRIIDCIRNLT
ncbi:MAG: hypothetical protein WC530_10910 [Candidatus Omnitrophota bacterium]|jgi:hypothetical protein